MNSVIKGASYVLAHTPDMVLYNGTTQTTERIVNPESEYLKELPGHLRSYEDAVSYWPNQTYIGNVHPDELAEVEFPYYDKKKEGAERYGKYGEIMPEEEFLFLVQACDMFEVVKLDKEFVAKYKDAFAADPIISDDIVEKIEEGVEIAEIEALINDDHAEALYFENKLVGCIKPAHDIDVNLSSHVMHENLMSKASSVLALLYAVRNAGIDKADVEYVIDCAEEACGDMNQRGGGNFAKAAALINDDHAEALYFENKLVGCIKPAHDIDVNLSSHVMHENLMSKASSVLALLYAVRNAGIDKADVEYVIDCAEEACGDMNQRGGGNFAKAAAEVAGLVNATGSDARGFCAAPTHALIEAAALVKSGAYKTVVVTAGGCTAKLGMNGKDHVKKGLPILEDCLGGFAVVISENDGVNPEIDLGMLGRHSVGTGSAPQNVIGSLVADPLDRVGMKITDIDKFSPEMQNPDITKPAGAGDVPLANYKMIAALAVKRGELDRKELASFTKDHGLTGWAPTQGHIPSGVPYVGFAREDILEGKIKNAMIIGKGSLFLGRMTNLFDGVSFVIHGNTKAEEEAAAGVSEEEVKGLIAKAMKDFAATLMAE